jgi:hypothetical protein
MNAGHSDAPSARAQHDRSDLIDRDARVCCVRMGRIAWCAVRPDPLAIQPWTSTVRGGRRPWTSWRFAEMNGSRHSRTIRRPPVIRVQDPSGAEWEIAASPRRSVENTVAQHTLEVASRVGDMGFGSGMAAGFTVGLGGDSWRVEARNTAAGKTISWTVPQGRRARRAIRQVERALRKGDFTAAILGEGPDQ